MREHRGLERLEDRVRSKKWVDATGAREQSDLGVVADRPHEARDEMSLRVGIIPQGFEELDLLPACLILHDRVEKIVLFEFFENEIEQIELLDYEAFATNATRQSIHQETNSCF